METLHLQVHVQYVLYIHSIQQMFTKSSLLGNINPQHVNYGCDLVAVLINIVL